MKFGISILKYTGMFSFVIGCSLLTGCATASLWHNHNYAAVKSVIEAEAKQIYISYDKTEVDHTWLYKTKFCIPFQVKDSDKAKANKLGLPKKTQGFLCIDNFTNTITDATSYDTALKSLFNENASSIDLIYISNIGSDWQINVAFTSKNATEIKKLHAIMPFTQRNTTDLNKLYPIVPFLTPIYQIPPSINRISNFKSPYETRSYSESYKERPNRYYYEPLKCVSNPCTIKTEAIYYPEIELNDWKPILPVGNVPVPLSFNKVETDRDYENNIVARVLFWPFTLAVDVVTFPFQLLIIIYGPKG